MKTIQDLDNLAKDLIDNFFEGRDWGWIAGNPFDVIETDNTFFQTIDVLDAIRYGMTIQELFEWYYANDSEEMFINLNSWQKGFRHNMISSKK